MALRFVPQRTNYAFDCSYLSEALKCIINESILIVQAGKKPAPKKIGDKKEKAGEGEKVC